MIGIMIPVFDRPEYFQKTINALLKADLNNCMICIVDDGSKIEELKRMYRFFIIQHIPMIKIVKEKNVGMWDSMRIGFDTLIKYGCDTLMNLDSDTIVKPEFVKKMNELLLKFPNNIISGFNQRNKDHIISVKDDYTIKTTVGGASMMFTKSFYIQHIKKHLINNLWDINLGKEMIKLKKQYYVTKPSVVQHIGERGLNSNKKIYDYAEDY